MECLVCFFVATMQAQHTRQLTCQSADASHCIHSFAADKQGQNPKGIRALRSATPVHQLYRPHVTCLASCAQHPLVTRDMAVFSQRPQGHTHSVYKAGCNPFEKNPRADWHGDFLVCFGVVSIMPLTRSRAAIHHGKWDAEQGAPEQVRCRRSNLRQAACEEQRRYAPIFILRSLRHGIHESNSP